VGQSSRIISFLCGLILWSSIVVGKRTQNGTGNEIFLSFRYSGGVSSVIIAYTFDDKIFIPVSELFDLLYIYHEIDISALIISGYFLDPKQEYLIDFPMGRAEYEGKIISFNASNYLIKEVDFYIEPWVLEELLNLNFSADASDLILYLKTPDIMPVEMKGKRKISRESLKNTNDDIHILREFKQTERHLFRGGYIDYITNSQFNREIRQNSADLSFGGELLFGESKGSLALSKVGNNTKSKISKFNWRYVFSDYPWLTEINAGELFSSGLSVTNYKGFRFSNEPVNPLQSFDTFIIDGYTINEAEVELYQNGKLVDFITSDADGYYRFKIPLNYGSSDVKIKIYGPNGEIIENDRKIQVPYNFVKTDEINYSIELGQTLKGLNQDSNPYFINANTAVGITNNITSRFGLQYSETDSTSKPLYYNSLSARVFSSYLANLEWISDSFSRLSFHGIFSSGKSFGLVYTKFDSTGPFNTANLDLSINSNIYFPFILFTKSNSLRLSLNHQSYLDKSIQNIGSFNFNTSIKKMRLKIGYRETINNNNLKYYGRKGNFILTNIYSLPRHSRFIKYLRGLYIRTQIQIDYPMKEKKPRSIVLQLVKQINRWGKINFSYAYDYQVDSYRIEFGFTYDFEQIRTSSRLRINNGIENYIQTTRGSIGFDQNTKEFILDERHQVGKSGVSVRLFLDENNSGTLDSKESILTGNALRIKNSSSRGSVKNNIARFSQLLPYKKYIFYIDESKIMNPMLSPTYKEFTFVPDPNQFSRLDVPFRMTGIIDGSVLIDKGKGESPIGGLRVKLRSKGGEYEKTIKTFTDGSFYAMEIPPGTYELRVDETQLQFLKAKSKPEILEVEVKAAKEGDFVQGLDFLLTPLGE